MTEQAHHEDKLVGEWETRDSALKFEALVQLVTSLLTSGTVDDLDDTFGTVLPVVAECLDVERAHVCELSQEDGQMRIIRSWPDAVQPDMVIDDVYPWSVRRILLGEETVISCLDDLPPEANTERSACERRGISAFLTLPLAVSGLSLGCLTVAVTRTEQRWSEVQLQRLRVVAHLLANALERKRAGEALRTSANWFRQLVENAPDAIIMVKRDGTIALINDEAERLFGHAPCELVGQSVDVLLPEAFRHAHAKQRSAYGAAPKARRMGTTGLDLIARAKDGRELPVEISLTPVDGKNGLIICIVRDVSGRRRLEDELRAEVGQRLKTARVQLENQASQLNDVHHHVTDHFRILSDLVKLQQQRLDGNVPVLEELSEIQNRIGAITSVHEALSTSDTLESVNLSHYLARVTRRLRSRYEADRLGVAVVLDVEPLSAAPTVALRCGLIVSELVTNGLKHAFPGDRSGTIGVSLHRNGPNTWELAVRDDGAGTAQSLDLDGLGIRLVEKLATQLGGNTAFSADGGITAVVRLPVAPEGVRSAEVMGADPPLSTSSSVA